MKYMLKLSLAVMTMVLMSPFSLAGSGEKERVIKLDGESNFRDIGGYKTVDGKTVKMGKVYRSGELPNLSDKDLKRLEELKITTVANFLLPEEIEGKGKDRIPKGAKELLIPISTEKAKSLIQEGVRARQTGDFSKLPVELNPFIHKLMPSAGASSYAILIREIIKDKEGALVYHCSHGIHRTGTATAIILSLVGVPWESVREDYLITNVARKDVAAKRIEQLGRMTAKTQNIPFEEVDMTNIKAFYILEGEYIDATRDEIIKNYGSFENYANKALGLSDEEIEALKKALLH